MGGEWWPQRIELLTCRQQAKVVKESKRYFFDKSEKLVFNYMRLIETIRASLKGMNEKQNGKNVVCTVFSS